MQLYFSFGRLLWGQVKGKKFLKKECFASQIFMSRFSEERYSLLEHRLLLVVRVLAWVTH